MFEIRKYQFSTTDWAKTLEESEHEFANFQKPLILQRGATLSHKIISFV